MLGHARGVGRPARVRASVLRRHAVDGEEARVRAEHGRRDAGRLAGLGQQGRVAAPPLDGHRPVALGHLARQLHHVARVGGALQLEGGDVRRDWQQWRRRLKARFATVRATSHSA